MFNWHFWIGFRECDQVPPGFGGVGVAVEHETLDGAIAEANRRAAQVMELLDMDSGGVGIFFATDAPFGRQNLVEVTSEIDGGGPTRMIGEELEDWLRRVDLYVEDCCACAT